MCICQRYSHRKYQLSINIIRVKSHLPNSVMDYLTNDGETNEELLCSNIYLLYLIHSEDIALILLFLSLESPRLDSVLIHILISIRNNVAGLRAASPRPPPVREALVVALAVTGLLRLVGAARLFSRRPTSAATGLSFGFGGCRPAALGFFGSAGGSTGSVIYTSLT